MFLPTQYSLLYIYLYIVNVFKYLFLLSENKKVIIIIIKKMSLSKFSVVLVFPNMLYSRKRKPENAGNHFLHSNNFTTVSSFYEHTE